MNGAWVNGERVDAASVDDSARSRSPGVFETVGAQAGQTPLWERHLQRLRAGAGVLGIPCTVPDRLRDAAEKLLADNRDDILRITLHGTPAPCWTLTSRRRRRLAVVRLHVVVVGARRLDPLAGLKTTSRALHREALAEAERAGADDALLVDDRGHVLETTTGNVFVVLDGVIHTPSVDGGLLPGIARAALLEGARARGHDVRESDCPRTWLERTDAVVVCNAVYGPRPALWSDRAACPIEPLAGLWPGILAGRA